MAARTGRPVEDWLGQALEEMTEEQVDQMASAVRQWEALPTFDASDSDAVLTGMLQHLLGELDLPAMGRAYRDARTAVEAATLGAVLAGKPEAEAARESTLDRMIVRRMVGKR
jgi:hypothetical protein